MTTNFSIMCELQIAPAGFRFWLMINNGLREVGINRYVQMRSSIEDIATLT